MYPFLKDASFCPRFCFVHTIAQFSRILRFSHIYCQIFRIRTHGWRKWRTTALTSRIGSEKFQKFQKFKYGTFLTLSLKLMQWYVTSVIRGSLYEKFGNQCMKILKLWRIRVITKLPNSEQSYKGKVKTHNYINRQNQSTTGKLWKP
jgi:hypothetical protein